MAKGLPSYRHPDGAQEMAKEFEEIYRQIRALRRAIGGGLTIDGTNGDLVIPGRKNIRLGTDGDGSGALLSSSFDGTDFANPGTQGNYFGDDGLVLNDVKFRPGSVGNDALTNPVRGDVSTAATSGFALGTAMATLTSATWTVPDGFNQAQVFGSAKVFAYNPTAGLDYLQARSRIVRVSDGAEVTGVVTPTAVSASNGSGTSIGLGVAVVQLNPGDQIRLEVQGSSSFAAWAANVGNTAEWTGIINWYRVTP